MSLREIMCLKNCRRSWKETKDTKVSHLKNKSFVTVKESVTLTQNFEPDINKLRTNKPW
jgi:hypothetical protein